MIYEFGPYRLDAGERVLRRQGEIVQMSPKVFDILIVLVQNSGRVLTKHEIIELVWPDTVVDESNLARNVSTLRRALEDEAIKKRYIETIHWRGYRFIPYVRVTPAQAGIDSLAVLPFLNESGDPAVEYLSDGITETLINRLSLLSHLKVMSRNSVFRYKVLSPNQTFLEAKAVGKALEVRAVLTGRIKQADGQLIVSVELVDATDNRQIWGAQYRRALSDIFALQEAIAREIAQRLQLQLSSSGTLLTKRHTESPEAYHLFLKGRFFLNKLTLEGAQKAMELFEQAIERDPDYALAYTGLLDCHLRLHSPTEARKAADRALELDPALGEAHASRGVLVFLHDWDWLKAEDEFQQAIELNSNCAAAHQWYALCLAKMGRHQEAIFEARMGQQLDPLSLSINLTAGLVLCFAREYDRAIQELQKVIEMEANSAATHTTLGLAYTYRKMCDEAIVEFRKASTLAEGSPDVEAYIKTLIAYCYATCGRTEKAKTFLIEIQNQPTVSPYSLGMIHAQLGEHTLALDLLERAYQEHNVQVLGLKVDPALDPLRSSVRFQSLLTRVGLPL